MFEEGECFLCQPDSELIVGRHGNIFSMVGLGPITDRYLMIATNAHVRSFADMYLQDQCIADKVQALRVKLQYNTKPLLMTEHGRVPVCLKDDDQHDPHCFHAHFLIFQSAEDIEELVASYFLERKVFYSLSDALAFATKCENYHLFSPHSKRYVVFSGALNVPRQFFRRMISLTEGQSELFDWRDRPNLQKTIQLAHHERSKMEKSNEVG